MNELEKLAEQWEQIKAAEAQVIARRRAIEDQITQILALQKDMDGAKTENVARDQRRCVESRARINHRPTFGRYYDNGCKAVLLHNQKG